MGELQQVVPALQDVLNKSDDSNTNDTPTDSQSFFCVEDTLSAEDVLVTVNNVGHICFPIKEHVINKLIGISQKAKFGKGLHTVLDTSYRDTQTIPGDQIKVEIDEDVLDNLLENLGKSLNLEDHSRLEIHLYNMLIYGPGQFFKRHQDTEKVKNMIATLVMVLPSPHKGGDLIIEHHNLKHRFFGSLDNDVIKCIAFYSDCFHEVKEVDEGYRVALTYNVEIKCGPLPDLTTIDEKLQDAVNNYFEDSGADMLVYYLDHQYTEHSLRWYLLKGSDRICAKALLSVGKLESYEPCLALVEYHESWQENCESDKRKFIDFYYWIDENNIRLNSKKISVSEKKICFMKDTKKDFKPYKREKEGYMGNWSGNIDVWYHRSAVVLWRDKWAYFNEYKKEFHNLPGYANFKDTLFSINFFFNFSEQVLTLTKDMQSFIKTNVNMNKIDPNLRYSAEMKLSLEITFPLTLVHGLNLLNFNIGHKLVVHIVGAEPQETGNIHKWELILHLFPQIKQLTIFFIGPDLEETNEHHKCASCKKTVKFKFSKNLYHDFVNSFQYQKPDIVCTFHPGFYANKEYAEAEGNDDFSYLKTLPLLFKDTPYIMTSLDEREVILDRKILLDINPNLIIKTMKNPFAALLPIREIRNRDVYYLHYYISWIVKKSSSKEMN